ncbi:MAG: protein kinase [Acidobacteria bacterium]|nr:protein kinase [Acidobacteriota bacterium]
MKVCHQCKTCLEDNAIRCPIDGSQLAQPFDGTKLIDGKYLIEKWLGQGGMGAVYLVRHVGLDKHFALKLIHTYPSNHREFARRFSVEAKAMGKLKHPNIVDVTDYGIDPRGSGLPYLVMEHLVGETLRQKLKDSSRLSFSEMLWILEHTAEGIDYAHRHGVLHCDLKPENVFLCKNDGKDGEEVKILDFGLARLLRREAYQGGEIHGSQIETADIPVLELKKSIVDGPEVSETAATPDGPQGVWGTPAYMAPEVINGREPGKHSDLYSFGIMVYELLAGAPPFSGTAMNMMRAHVSNPPPKPSESCREITPEIEAAILMALEKDPGTRPITARTIVRLIRNAGLQSERRHWRSREIPRRAVVAGILAPLMAVVWFLVSLTDFVSNLEGKTVDARFAFSKSRSPDPRILITTIDDRSLESDKIPIANKADEISETLHRVFDAQAAGVAIDFILPYSWSRSQSFSRLVLENADRITLAAFAGPSGEIIGTDCITGLTSVALGSRRVRSLFGLVNLQESNDGIVRRARVHYPDIVGINWNSWPAMAADSLMDPKEVIQKAPVKKAGFWIDYSADWRQIEHISWNDIGRWLNSDPMFFEHRLLLLGGDYLAGGDDYHRVPAPFGFPKAVSGVVLQALIVDTLLSGRRVREMPVVLSLALVVFLCSLVLFGSLCIQRIRIAACLFAGVILINTIAAFVIFRWLKLIVPVFGPMAILLLAFCTAMLLRRKLTPFPSSEASAL